MVSLDQFTQQIENKYANTKTETVSTQQIALTTEGLLRVGKKEMPMTTDALCQFARFGKIPTQFFLEIPSDLRAAIFNRLLPKRLASSSLAHNIRLTVDNQDQIHGFDDPTLHKLEPVILMKILKNSLPNNLSADQVEVGNYYLRNNIMSISCYTPIFFTEPRKGDIINGGVDIYHSITGEMATQVRCYIRRQICQNGATAHICSNEKK